MSYKADKPIKVDFSGVSTSAGATAYTVACQPGGLGARILGIADNYEFYHLESLRFRLIPVPLTSGTTAGLNAISACWLGGVSDTTPSTLGSVCEAPDHVVLGMSQTTPTEWCKVPKRALAGYNPWYKTVQGTPDTGMEIQGNIYIVTPITSAPYLLELRGVIVFKGAVAPSSTPMLRQMNELKREKERLLRILSSSTTPSSVGLNSPGLLPQKSL